MSEQLVTRLEAAVQRLEAVARKMGSGGDEEAGGVPAYVAEFDRFVHTDVAAAVKAVNDLGVPDMGPLITQAFNGILELIKRLPNSKKPEQKDLIAFLAPTSDAIAKADNIRYRGKDLKKWGDQYKACYELIVSAQWVVMVPPAGSPLGHCEQQTQAVDFNLNRVIKEAKDDKTKTFVQALKKVCKTQTDFVKEQFKTGLTWNAKGGDLSSAASASVPAAAHTEERKDEKPKTETKPAAKANESAGGMNAVFGELGKGLDITKGLNTVTPGMKSKNRTDKTGIVREAPKKSGPKREKGPSNLKFVGGRWIAENFSEGEQVLDKADMKSNVYIAMCDDTKLVIPGKVKSITVDSCIKCDIIINEVISTVEMVNCKSVTLWLQDKAPSIAVDKSQSARVVLSKKSFDCAPDIITSNVTAMNVEIPGVEEKADNVEIPVPEQFITRIDPKTRAMTTTEVKHG